MPGVVVKGLAIKAENSKQLTYNCNALSSWYLTLFLVAFLHFTGIYELWRIFDRAGPLMICALITGDLISMIVYLSAKFGGKSIGETGNFIYDFFVGIYLNPR